MKKLLLVVLSFSLLLNSYSTQAINTSRIITNSAITLAFSAAVANLSSSEDLPKSLVHMAAGLLLAYPFMSNRFDGENSEVNPVRFSSDARSKSRVDSEINVNVNLVDDNRKKKKEEKSEEPIENKLEEIPKSSGFSLGAAWRSTLFVGRSALLAGGIHTLGVGCKLFGNYIRGCEPLSTFNLLSGMTSTLNLFNGTTSWLKS